LLLDNNSLTVNLLTEQQLKCYYSSIMFQAIRRVISESEDVGQSNPKKAKTEMSSDERAAPLRGTVLPQTQSSPNTDTFTSHLVEPDAKGVDTAAPLQVVHSTGHHDTCASNSSLSDGSDNDSLDGAEDPLVPAAIIQPQPSTSREEKEQIVPPHVLTRVAPRSNTLNRMDSSAADGSSSGSQRNSSQNSRDWGWFEDVHQATVGLNVNEKRDTKKNTARTPGMAQPETAHGTWSATHSQHVNCRIACRFL
jgi:hypothetical protein